MEATRASFATSERLRKTAYAAAFSVLVEVVAVLRIRCSAPASSRSSNISRLAADPLPTSLVVTRKS
jgi:hypothetical protein